MGFSVIVFFGLVLLPFFSIVFRFENQNMMIGRNVGEFFSFPHASEEAVPTVVRKFIPP
jgi:hypothetical protein